MSKENYKDVMYVTSLLLDRAVPKVETEVRGMLPQGQPMDPAAFGCAYTRYGIEFLTQACQIPQVQMVDYLRQLADALEDGTPLPAMSFYPPGKAKFGDKL
jgi:hypothetical protein